MARPRFDPKGGPSPGPSPPPFPLFPTHSFLSQDLARTADFYRKPRVAAGKGPGDAGAPKVSSTAAAKSGAPQIAGVQDSIAAVPSGAWIEHIGWTPRAFLYHGFLTPEECDHLRSKAEPQLLRSTALDATTGEVVTDDIRTSYGMFFARGEDDVIRRIEARIAAWVHLPIMNGEGLQILRCSVV